MKMNQTIKVSKQVKANLDKLKVIPEETYNGVIERLIKEVRK